MKGESIPIRVFLAGYDLTPTMRDINKKFSVRYYLNLVLVDEEDRRYFKQQVSLSAALFLRYVEGISVENEGFCLCFIRGKSLLESWITTYIPD